MRFEKCTWLLAASYAFTLVGCDVDIEDKGELPSVKVEEGEMPEVDVRGPDVDVGTEEKTVSVPDVDVEMEEKKVSVPDIDVDVPEEDEN